MALHIEQQTDYISKLKSAIDDLDNLNKVEEEDKHEYISCPSLRFRDDLYKDRKQLYDKLIYLLNEHNKLSNLTNEICNKFGKDSVEFNNFINEYKSEYKELKKKIYQSLDEWKEHHDKSFMITVWLIEEKFKIR